jgi:hypothetical protein
MKEDLPVKTTSKKSRKRLVWLLVILAAILASVTICGLASYATSTYYWDGGFPGGEFTLRVQDSAGQPVVGAVLNVYSENGSTPSLGYPFDNYLAENGLVSNSEGEIALLHIARGIEFGGGGWYLFWVFPMGGTSSSPEYRCEISANGYTTDTILGSEIFGAAWGAAAPVPTRVIEFEGESHPVSVYKIPVVLDKK